MGVGPVVHPAINVIKAAIATANDKALISLFLI
jgi:hypothetical protein